jgi:hypothetical protein
LRLSLRSVEDKALAESPFAWLECLAPPILVRSTAYMLGKQVLDAIERRDADERSSQAALIDKVFVAAG